jgi:hypothetical protein
MEFRDSHHKLNILLANILLKGDVFIAESHLSQTKELESMLVAHPADHKLAENFEL